jgi:hypothetical protein
VLLATIDGAGRLQLPARTEGGYATVALPGLDVDEAGIARALQSAEPVLLRPASATLAGGDNPPRRPQQRAAFMVDLIVVPAKR